MPTACTAPEPQHMYINTSMDPDEQECLYFTPFWVPEWLPPFPQTEYDTLERYSIPLHDCPGVEMEGFRTAVNVGDMSKYGVSSHPKAQSEVSVIASLTEPPEDATPKTRRSEAELPRQFSDQVLPDERKMSADERSEPMRLSNGATPPSEDMMNKDLALGGLTEVHFKYEEGRL